VGRREQGFTLIELMIVIAIIAVIAAFAIPNLLQSRMVANEAAALSGIKAAHAAQIIYRRRHATFAQNLEQLVEARLLDETFRDDRRQGYDFGVINAGPDDFMVGTRPISYERTGTRSFIILASGQMYWTSAPDPTAVPRSDLLPVGE
jgi:prepilin-type N-terminal cleavage/methylation domain-containing protein